MRLVSALFLIGVALAATQFESELYEPLFDPLPEVEEPSSSDLTDIELEDMPIVANLQEFSLSEDGVDENMPCAWCTDLQNQVPADAPFADEMQDDEMQEDMEENVGTPQEDEKEMAEATGRGLTALDPPSGTGAGTGADTGAGTGADTGAGAGTGADTGAGAGTGADTGTGAAPAVPGGNAQELAANAETLANNGNVQNLAAGGLGGAPSNVTSSKIEGSVLKYDPKTGQLTFVKSTDGTSTTIMYDPVTGKVTLMQAEGTTAAGGTTNAFGTTAVAGTAASGTGAAGVTTGSSISFDPVTGEVKFANVGGTTAALPATSAVASGPKAAGVALQTAAANAKDAAIKDGVKTENKETKDGQKTTDTVDKEGKKIDTTESKAVDAVKATETKDAKSDASTVQKEGEKNRDTAREGAKDEKKEISNDAEKTRETGRRVEDRIEKVEEKNAQASKDAAKSVQESLDQKQKSDQDKSVKDTARRNEKETVEAIKETEEKLQNQRNRDEFREMEQRDNKDSDGVLNLLRKDEKKEDMRKEFGEIDDKERRHDKEQQMDKNFDKLDNTIKKDEKDQKQVREKFDTLNKQISQEEAAKQSAQNMRDAEKAVQKDIKKAADTSAQLSDASKTIRADQAQENREERKMGEEVQKQVAGDATKKDVDEQASRTRGLMKEENAQNKNTAQLDKVEKEVKDDLSKAKDLEKKQTGKIMGEENKIAAASDEQRQVSSTEKNMENQGQQTADTAKRNAKETEGVMKKGEEGRQKAAEFVALHKDIKGTEKQMEKDQQKVGEKLDNGAKRLKKSGKRMRHAVDAKMRREKRRVEYEQRLAADKINQGLNKNEYVAHKDWNREEFALARGIDKARPNVKPGLSKPVV